MGHHYSTRDFLHQMPDRLLTRYFAGWGVLREVDFAVLKESQPPPLFETWLALPGVGATRWTPSSARFTR